MGGNVEQIHRSSARHSRPSARQDLEKELDRPDVPPTGESGRFGFGHIKICQREVFDFFW